jgi:DNA-binding NarL/FixJ family response regulator
MSNQRIPQRGRCNRDALGLTPRQADILRLLVEGKCDKQIMRATGLSPGTVKVHTGAVFRALGVTSRTQVIVAVARRCGIEIGQLVEMARTTHEGRLRNDIQRETLTSASFGAR